MNQNIRKTIAIGLITCLLSLLCGFSSAFADADNGCTLQISFDKTEYKTGDAAKVTVKLSDVADEIAVGRKLGAFELHIFYESEALSFQGASLNETVKAAADAAVAQPAELDSENIVLAFSALDGVEVTEGMTLA